MEEGETGDPHDEVMRVGHVEVRVDKTSLMWLIGTEIDWVEDRMGSRFVFKNPNATAACGCGISFSPDVGKAPSSGCPFRQRAQRHALARHSAVFGVPGNVLCALAPPLIDGPVG